MSKQKEPESNVKDFCERWLSDGIDEEYKDWIKQDVHGHVWHTTNVFIESPTGTGKTTFVFEKLFPYAVEHKRNILYLSNRTALKEQLVKSAEDKYTVEEEEIDLNKQGGKVINVHIRDSDDKQNNYENKLTILNYQSALSYIKNNEEFRVFP